MQRVRVWDLPTRVFHWLLALSVLGLLVTGQIGGNAMNWHLRFGQAVLALLVWRLVWGLVGGHWSRFSRFLYGPSAVLAYLRGRSPALHSVGHSPLGALSVWAILLVLAAQVGSGLMTDDEIAFFGPLVPLVGGDWVATATRWHKNVGQWLVLALVVLHLAALLVYRLRGHPPLIGPMVTGDKLLEVAAPSSRDDALTRAGALLLMLAAGAAVVWVFGLSASGGSAGVY